MGTETAYFPQIFNYGPKVNLLNIYLGREKTDEVAKTMRQIDGTSEPVNVSQDGSYSADVDVSDEESKNFFWNLFSKMFTTIGDVLQSLIDSARTEKSLLYSRHTTYSKEDIMANSELQKEIEVGDEGTEGTNTHATAKIPNTVVNRSGEIEANYTEETEIPVIPMDLYSISTNKIRMLDINFYDNTNTSSIWKFVANIVKTCSRAVMYISAGILLTILIWRAILLVKSSLGGNPEEMSETKKIMNSWIKGVALVALVYVIATLVIYIYEWIINLIIEDYDTSYLIRANVEGLYSFNTNIIGFIKYKTLTANELSALGFSLLYLAMAIFDFLWFLVMCVRFVFIAILTIIAPFTAITMTRGKDTNNFSTAKSILSFKGWLLSYSIAVGMPLIIIIIYRLLILVI